MFNFFKSFWKNKKDYSFIKDSEQDFNDLRVIYEKLKDSEDPDIRAILRRWQKLESWIGHHGCHVIFAGDFVFTYLPDNIRFIPKDWEVKEKP